MIDLKSISENVEKSFDGKGEHRPDPAEFSTFTMRPDPDVAALIDVLAYLQGQTPTAFIASFFKDAVADFVVKTDRHLKAAELIALVAEKMRYRPDPNHPENALDCLIEKGAIEAREDPDDDET